MSNTRIAKNTLFLYFRMLLIMLTNLYVVRLVLDMLGAMDYGIYVVVGGVVIMFSFLSDTLSSSSQRYFAFAIGEKNFYKLNIFFNITLILYITLAVFILIIAETLGVWFVNNKLIIPETRLESANIVFQFAILSFIFNIIKTPYTALVIAHEKMNIFAIIGVVEVFLKLILIFILKSLNIDKLKAYSIIIFLNILVIFIIYFFYSKFKFKETKFKLYYKRKEYSEILTYSGWNIIGAVSNMLRNQGINVLLNLFFSPIINAARGIAYQINTAILSLTNNFYIAVKPQITKKYANQNLLEMKKLVYSSSKLAFVLMMVICIPIFYETKFILSIWLKELPSYVIIFTRLVVINSLIEVINQPLVSAIQATGNVKIYQLTVSLILILNLPLSLLCLSAGYPPEITMYISIFLSIISYIPRMYICQKVVGIRISDFVSEVLLKLVIITFLMFFITWCIWSYFNESFLRFSLVIIVNILVAPILLLFIGFNDSERTRIKQIISNYVK